MSIRSCEAVLLKPENDGCTIGAVQPHFSSSQGTTPRERMADKEKLNK